MSFAVWTIRADDKRVFIRRRHGLDDGVLILSFSTALEALGFLRRAALEPANLVYLREIFAAEVGTVSQLTAAGAQDVLEPLAFRIAAGMLEVCVLPYPELPVMLVLGAEQKPAPLAEGTVAPSQTEETQEEESAADDVESFTAVTFLEVGEDEFFELELSTWIEVPDGAEEEMELAAGMEVPDGAEEEMELAAGMEVPDGAEEEMELAAGMEVPDGAEEEMELAAEMELSQEEEASEGLDVGTSLELEDEGGDDAMSVTTFIDLPVEAESRGEAFAASA